MPVLDIKGLTVRLPEGADREFAIQDVSLSVGKGEIVCIVGESGSGKSVTAFTVMGLIPRKDLTPVAGEILLQGDNLLTKSDRQMRALRGEKMAMVFQEPMTALNPVAKVGDQIAELLEIHTNMSASARKKRVIEAMDDVSLPDPEKMYDSYPHQLSGGQRQRIMIAMALALEPGLLIADEPTTALDVTVQAQILALLDDLRRERGLAILFITHDFGVVAQLCDRVAVMYAGRIVEEGPTDAILSAPAHPYTARLMACVPELGGGRRRLDAIPGLPPVVDNLPKGCAFAPRCEKAEGSCRAGEVALKGTAPRAVRCLYPEEAV